MIGLRAVRTQLYACLRGHYHRRDFRKRQNAGVNIVELTVDQRNFEVVRKPPKDGVHDRVDPFFRRAGIVFLEQHHNDAASRSTFAWLGCIRIIFHSAN